MFILSGCLLGGVFLYMRARSRLRPEERFGAPGAFVLGTRFDVSLGDVVLHIFDSLGTACSDIFCYLSTRRIASAHASNSKGRFAQGAVFCSIYMAANQPCRIHVENRHRE